MAFTPIFEFLNTVDYKSVDKEKIKIIMICVHAQCKQKQTKILIEHADHKSKSGRPVRPYSTSSTLFLLFVQQKCQNIARICSISLVH